MSGGGGLLGSILSSAKNSPAEGINSLFGTNLLNAGGASNDALTHWMNGITGFNVMNAGSPQADAMAAASNAVNPSVIGNLGPGSTMPHFPNPNLWAMPTPQGGQFNQMAQQLAGPVYTGGLQIPGVSPALLGQAIPQTMRPGMQSAIPQAMGAKGGMQNPIFAMNRRGRQGQIV